MQFCYQRRGFQQKRVRFLSNYMAMAWQELRPFRIFGETNRYKASHGRIMQQVDVDEIILIEWSVSCEQ